MDVKKINAVRTEYGGMIRSAVAGDPEALGRLLSMAVDLSISFLIILR